MCLYDDLIRKCVGELTDVKLRRTPKETQGGSPSGFVSAEAAGGVVLGTVVIFDLCFAGVALERYNGTYLHTIS